MMINRPHSVAKRVALVAGVFLFLSAGVPPTLAVASREAPPKGATLLPVNKTTTVRGRGTAWYIDGPTIIPHHVELRIELGTRVYGINNASLEVKGGLKIHGTKDYWVKIHKVDFSPTVDPQRGCHLDMIDFYGCTFAHKKDKPFGGKMTIENCTFQRDCELKFRMHAGFLKIMTVNCGAICEIYCEPSTKKFIELEIRSSWMGPLMVNGMCRATVRHCELRQGIECVNVHDIEIDGCDIRSDLTITQRPEDVFKKIVLTKCNMFSGAKLIVKRPPSDRTKKERIRLNKFYFGEENGVVIKGKKIAGEIEDGKDMPKGEGNVFVNFKSHSKSVHKLVSYTLRSRVAPLN